MSTGKRKSRREQGAAQMTQMNNPAARAGAGRLSLRAPWPLLLLCALCLAVVGLIVAAFSGAMFHSDSAFFPLLAREQLLSGKLFPEGMCYSTVLFVRTPNLLMIPFLAGGMTLLQAHNAGIIVLWILTVLAIFWAFSPRRERNTLAAVIASCLLMIPFLTNDVAHETTDMLFFQGAYLPILLDTALILGAVHRIMLLKGSDTRRKKALWYVVLFVFILVPLLGSIRDDLLITIPLFLALAIFYYHQSTERRIRSVLKNHRILLCLLVIVLGSGAGYVGSHLIAARVWTRGKASEMIIQTSSSFTKNILAAIDAISIYFGNTIKVPMLGVLGVYRMLGLLYMIALMLIVPVVALRHYDDFTSDFTRVLALFTQISNLLTALIAIATGETASRYYLTLPLFNILLLGALFSEYAARRSRRRMVLLSCVVLAFTLFCQSQFVLYYKTERFSNPCAGLSSYLQEHGLTYGYASYWNSYNLTVLSDAKVLCVSMGDHRGAPEQDRADYDPQYRYEWLTNTRWYDAKEHPGRCFVLLSNTYEEALAERYLPLAQSELQYKDFSILIFDSAEQLQSVVDPDAQKDGEAEEETDTGTGEETSEETDQENSTEE